MSHGNEKHAQRPKIIVARRYGQLGNCLYLYSHLIAIARECDAMVVNPAFGKYASLFRTTADDLLCRFPVVASRLPTGERARQLAYQVYYLPTRFLAGVGLKHWPLEVIRLRGDERCELDEAFAERLRRRGRLYLHGWLFRADQIYDKHLPAIREHFRPIEKHERAVEAALQQARQTGGPLIGVHIRHGDYATFLDGRYYYSLEQYRVWMEQAVRELGSNVGFLVCSDSRLSVDQFPGLNVTLGPGHLLEDMYALAGCDQLIGPPSTFSGWASIYGGVPLQRIETADQRLCFAEHQRRRAS